MQLEYDLGAKKIDIFYQRIGSDFNDTELIEKDNPITNYNLEFLTLTPGAYKFTFDFFDGNGLRIYKCTEIMNVYANMETNRWVYSGGTDYISGTSGTGQFSLKKEHAQKFQATAFYVSSTGSSDNTGTYYDPMDSIQGAINQAVRVKASTGYSEPFTIWLLSDIEGGEVQEDTELGDCLITLGSDIKIKLSSHGEKRTVNAGSTSSNIYRIMNICSDASVELSNIVLKGGNAKDAGGGIYNKGTLTLANGAEISGNTVTKTSSSSNCTGGGIYNAAGATLYVESGSTVDANEASEGDGGNIYIAANSTFSMTGGTISHGSAKSGGGLYICASSIVPSVTGGSFIGNEAVSSGGAIWEKRVAEDRDLDFSGLTIKNNSAAKGAGIYARGNVIIKNCTIAENTAAVDGGAITSNNWNVYVSEGSEIYGNHAKRGGALTSTSESGNCTIFVEDDANVHDNFASECGNEVFILNSIVDSTTTYVGKVEIRGGTISHTDSAEDVVHGEIYIRTGQLVLSGTPTLNKIYNENPVSLDGTYKDAGKILISGDFIPSSTEAVEVTIPTAVPYGTPVIFGKDTTTTLTETDVEKFKVYTAETPSSAEKELKQLVLDSSKNALALKEETNSAGGSITVEDIKSVSFSFFNSEIILRKNKSSGSDVTYTVYAFAVDKDGNKVLLSDSEVSGWNFDFYDGDDEISGKVLSAYFPPPVSNKFTVKGGIGGGTAIGVIVTATFNEVEYSSTLYIDVDDDDSGDDYPSLSSLTDAPTEGTYSLSTDSELLTLSQWSNTDHATFVGVTLVLTSDITITSGWTPLSPTSASGLEEAIESEYAFAGTFDGNGHSLTLPYGEMTDKHYRYTQLMFFNKGTVKNLKMKSDSPLILPDTTGYEGDDYNGEQSFGSICVYNSGKVINCENYVSIASGTARNNNEGYGGIVSRNNIDGVVQNCANYGNFTLTFTNQLWISHDGGSYNYGMAGGIAGNNYGDIENCVNYGTIKVSNSNTSVFAGAGGILGRISDNDDIAKGIAGLDVDDIYPCSPTLLNCFSIKDCITNCNSNGEYADSNMAIGSINRDNVGRGGRDNNRKLWNL